MNKRRLAVIPARGGSKRILRKNIKSFLDTPIILRVIKEINKSDLFEEIHVSTEDDEIRQLVTEYGCEPRFKRPKELADDFTPISDVINFTIKEYKKYGKTFDTIFLVFPTAAMLKSYIIIDAVRKFESRNADLEMISIKKYPVPIEWAYKIDPDSIVEPISPDSLKKRSQDLVDKYYETGEFVIYTSKSYNKNYPRIGYEIPYQTVDIDDESDWLLAENLARVQELK